MRSITIRVPGMIPKELTPNTSWYTHWGTKHKARDQLKHDTFYACVDALIIYSKTTGRNWEPLKKARVDYTFVVPDKRYVRDDDNQIAGCKFLVDTLQGDMGGIITDDKGLSIGSIKWEFGEPEIIIKVTEVA